jgi:hypothetical protein
MLVVATLKDKVLGLETIAPDFPMDQSVHRIGELEQPVNPAAIGTLSSG